MSAPRRHVFLVDDNGPFLASTRWLLESFGFGVEDFSQAPALLERLVATPPPGDACVVSDIRMPGMTGLQLLDALRARGLLLPVVFVTGHGDVPLAVEAMRKGAADFLEKPFTDQALADAVGAAGTTATGSPALGPDPRLDRLSPRERQVLDLVVASKPNKIIADVLGISIKTVELHRRNMMGKLEAGSVQELMKRVLGP
ncbi:MAG: response regulator transcription factor [Lysobacteraceae bacterium]